MIEIYKMIYDKYDLQVTKILIRQIQKPELGTCPANYSDSEILILGSLPDHVVTAPNMNASRG